VCEPRPAVWVDTLSAVAHRRWERLAEQVTARRAYLGYSIAQLSALSGLSTSTLDSIEHSRKTSYDPATLSALERALSWRPGSTERVLKGLDPRLVQDPDLEAVITAWPRLSPGARRMLRILATEGARAE
jgi:transcriptional regulator with XRE-family HTH domain